MSITNFNCRHCDISLNENIAVKRNEHSFGFRKECKPCYNSSKSKKTMTPCSFCGLMCLKKTLMNYCSTLCQLKNNVTIVNDCWEYKLTQRDKDGYGLCSIAGVTKRASRIMYELYNGKIKNNLFVCHTCDNPPCINPNHLWLGTSSENVIDSVKKNRHTGLKLSSEDVLKIRDMYRNDNKFKWIADLFNVSATHITNIIQKHKRKVLS